MIGIVIIIHVDATRPRADAPAKRGNLKMPKDLGSNTQDTTLRMGCGVSLFTISGTLPDETIRMERSSAVMSISVKHGETSMMKLAKLG